MNASEARLHLDPAWLESQYNVRARVAEHPRVFARWEEASNLVRQSLPLQANLSYGSGPRSELDLFPPALPAGTLEAAPPAPVLIFIHGGYWRSLDKDLFSFVAPAFTSRGVLVLVPRYPLCPQAPLEQICLQLTQVVAWAWRQAASFGADPGRIALVGHSAGAHLATMLLSCRWKDVDPALPAAPLSGALAISGLYDLEPLRHVPSLRGDLNLSAQTVARTSPAFFPRPRNGRLYAAVGSEESDEFLRQNRLIREVWGPSAVPVCETVPGKNHYTVLESLVDPNGRLHELTLRLLGLR